MALYQPTNIYPDLNGGVQNGVILLPYSGTISDVEVSWTVNGNSPMTDYQIDFYKNDAASTLTGTTGKVTLATPFSAVSADGTEQRFSVNVAYMLFSGTFVGATKRQGKFKITMWWGSGANDYVVQRSLSVFEMSRAGELYLNAPVGSLGDLTFTGGYNAPSATPEYFGKELNWTKWTVLSGSASGEVVQTTGKVWGATEYAWSPPTLYFGNYYLLFEAEQANGAVLSVGASFDVDTENVFFIDDVMNLACDHSKDAVSLQPKDKMYIRRRLTEDLEPLWAWDLPAGLESLTPWSLIWHGQLQAFYPAFILHCADGTMISARYESVTNSMVFSVPTTEQNVGQYTLTELAEAYICFTKGNFYTDSTAGYQFIVYNKTNSSTPNNAGVFALSSYVQSPITSISIHMDLYNNWFSDFTIGFGPNNGGIKAGYQDAENAATFSGAKIYLEKGLNSENAVVYYFGGNVSKYYLYRKEENEQVVKLVGAFLSNLDPSFESTVFDYSAVSGKNYDYYIYSERTADNEQNYPIERVKNVRPCFQNYDLIVAQKAVPADQSLSKEIFYTVVRAFNFAGNTSVGSYGNGGTRNVQPTFTPYPTVFRSTQNRREGTLTGLISVWSNGAYDFGAPGAYGATNDLEAALRWLSTMPSEYLLFLKDRRGNFIKVALAGEISMNANEASGAKEITASVPWVEIGEATETAFSQEWRYVPV